jgi:hypothetical protein
MQIDFNNPPSPDLRNPFGSAETYVRLEEVAIECDGEPCGLTSYSGEAMPPIQPPHSHIVVIGRGPRAGPWYYNVET